MTAKLVNHEPPITNSVARASRPCVNVHRRAQGVCMPQKTINHAPQTTNDEQQSDKCNKCSRCENELRALLTGRVCHGIIIQLGFLPPAAIGRGA